MIGSSRVSISRWFHFSDLHFIYDNFDTTLLRQSLENYIRGYIEETGMTSNCVVFSGDACHKGVYNSETVAFIKRLISVIGCPIHNVIICPGNHDAKRSRIRKRNLDDIIEQYFKQNNYNLNIPSEYRSVLITDPFKVFGSLYKSVKGKRPPPKQHYLANLEGVDCENINFYVFNTSIFAGQTYPEQSDISDGEREKENNNLFICDESLFVLPSYNNPHRLNVVVAHHAVECLNEYERTKFKNILDSLNIDLYLCGHVHYALLDTINGTKLEQKQVACGGLFIGENNQPNFSTGEFNSDTGNVVLTSHAYDNLNNTWSIFNTAPNPYEAGTYEYTPKRLHKKSMNTKNIPSTVLGEMRELSSAKNFIFGWFNSSPLEWITLQAETDRALLISRDCVIQREYHDAFVDVTWETCSLRRWLNEDFLTDAFTDSERNSIILSNNTNPDSAFGSVGGCTTRDRLFLLSVDEAMKYFQHDIGRISRLGDPLMWWWLRSPGLKNHHAAFVDENGSVRRHGTRIYYDGLAVRPAFWLDLSVSKILYL